MSRFCYSRTTVNFIKSIFLAADKIHGIFDFRLNTCFPKHISSDWSRCSFLIVPIHILKLYVTLMFSWVTNRFGELKKVWFDITADTYTTKEQLRQQLLTAYANKITGW